MEFLYQKSGQNESTYILTFPGDVPFFPETLIPTLMHRLEKSPLDVVVARSEQHLQPLFAAWALSAREKVKKYIDQTYSIFPFEKTWYKSRGVDLSLIHI